jgi:hypothetical protein
VICGLGGVTKTINVEATHKPHRGAAVRLGFHFDE